DWSSDVCSSDLRGRQNRLTASMSGFECLAVARIRNGWRPGFLLFLVLRTFTTTSSWSPHTCWLNLLASSPVVSRNFDGVALSLVSPVVGGVQPVTAF